MDNVSQAQKDIMAIKIVVQNMIALMNAEKQHVLKDITENMTNEMIATSGDLAHHLEDIKKSAMEMIDIATLKPE